jgi:predicted nucleic acid-binding Zn ribbon protein
LPEEPASGRPDDGNAVDDAAAGAPQTWHPEGTELARALLARLRGTKRARGPTTREGRLPEGGQPRPGEHAWSGAHPDDRDPQPVAATVDRFVDEQGWSTELRVHGVMARWDHIVGGDIAAHCRPERYVETELTIRADSTAWATQLRLLAPALVRRLNEELGDGIVTRIHVLGPSAPSWVKGPRRVKGRGPRDTYG